MNFLKPSFFVMCTRNFSKTVTALVINNRDWQPGKYPTTEKEKLTAAKKYGLLPKEYIPTPDDGFGLGDYPSIEKISSESRDIFYPWDYPEYRRNYGEVMHPNFNWLTEDRVNLQEKRYIPLYKGILGSLTFFAFMFWLIYLCEVYQLRMPHTYPRAAKDYPAPGVKHYHF